MSEVLLRQWAMLQAIPRRPRKVSANDLRARLEQQGYPIELRTIQRDLNALSGLFPLESDERSKPFGWSWSRDAMLDVPGMDLSTALMFTLAERYLEAQVPRSTLSAMSAHFKQAGEVLKRAGKGRLADWTGKVRILPRGQKLQPPDVDEQVLDVVYSALQDNRRFRVGYRRRGEAGTQEYEVNPLGLVFRDGIIYLVCTLWDYSDIRQLLLHRMLDAGSVDESRRVPKGFRLDDYIDSEAFAYPVAGGDIPLKVRFCHGAGFHLFETALSPDQKVTDEGDGVATLQATVRDTSELRWWLLGFGDNVEVLEPASLRKQFAAIAQRMAAQYAG